MSYMSASQIQTQGRIFILNAKLKTLLENLKIVVQLERNFCSPSSLSATQCEDSFDLEK